MELTQVAETVLKNRYYLKDDKNEVVEDWDKLCRRVSKFVGKGSKEQSQKFYDIIHELDFLPNSPCLMNAGTSIGQLSACFVLPVSDSMEGIFDAIKNGAIVHKTGGGTGYSFSDLRSKGAAVKSTNGVASGPLSFAKVFDSATDVIKQGGRRRGANMGVLRCLDGETLISTLDGKKKIKDLVGKKPYLYCCDPKTFEIHIEQAERIFVSDTNREMVRVVLDNDDFIECTKDHKFLLSSGEFKEAQHLELGESLCAFKKIIARHGRTHYTPYIGCTNSRMKKEYIVVAEDILNKPLEYKLVVHHKNFDSLNNSPENLEVLTISEHNRIHFRTIAQRTSEKRRGKTYEEVYGEERAAIWKQRMRESRKKFFENRKRERVSFTDDSKTLLECVANHKVVRVERIGVAKQVYDISLNTWHNFVANGVFVHNCDHPDIIDFIQAKQVDGEFKNFNFSVALTDEFMEAVKNNSEYDLIDPKFGFVRKENARKVFDMIVEYAWKNGEPGVLFIDAANRANTVPQLGRFKATNPCVVGSTKVFVADGRRSVEIRKLAEEGKDVPVYCRDARGVVHIRMMRRPRQTGEARPILKIKFDKNKYVRVTKEHAFILIDGRVVEAQHLKEGDCIAAMTRKISSDRGFEHIALAYSYDADELKKAFEKSAQNIESSASFYEDRQRVQKVCECCSKSFAVPVFQREQSFCSEECANSKKDSLKSYRAVEAFDQRHNVLKVVEVVEDGVEDVYNGTVDEFHNYCIGGFLMHSEQFVVEQFACTLNCGEQWLFENESCNLGSINLSNFVKNHEVDYERLKKVTEVAVEFLDNVIDVNSYPIEQIRETTLKTRKIGLGIMGLHDMLIQLELPYDCEEGRDAAYSVMKFIDEVAKTKSSDLGEAYGYFPAFDSSVNVYVGRRNAALTSIQPTGTVSMIADCASGCEPYFSIVTVKNVLDGKKLVMPNKHFERIAKNEGWYSNELMKKVYTSGSAVGLDEIPEKWQRIFKTSQDIHYIDHIKMQAALQKAVDSSISKTINMSSSATRNDVEKAYMLAYELGCKGITVYRDGSRNEQVLTVGTKGVVDKAVFQKLELPNVLDAKRYKLKDADGNSIYLIICFDEDENPMEVFAKFPYDNRLDMKDRSTMWTVVCRLVSLALRCKVPMKEIIKQLEKSSGNMFDLPAQLSKLLKSFMSETHFGYTTKCPDCGGVVEFKEGCESCSSCGYSKCS